MTSEISPPDRKRARVEHVGDVDIKPQSLKNSKHPTLYFRDGNVILRCRGTDFRVHNTLLSKNSTVFQGLFAAHELDTDEEHPGCIVVPLDDEAGDIEVLLHRVYDGFYIGAPKFTIISFPSIASLLRTSAKYELERPRNAILDLFRREWPSTLDLYDTKIAAANGTDGVHPAAVIALLRVCGYSSPDLFGPLFYELTTYAWKLADPVSGNHLISLPTADIQRFIVGLNALRSLQARVALCPLDDIPQTHKSCRSCLASVWCHTAYPLLARDKQDMCQPLRDWQELIFLFCMEQTPNDTLSNAATGAPPAAPPPPYSTPQAAPQAPHQNLRFQGEPMYGQANPQQAGGPHLHFNAGPGPAQGPMGQFAPQVGHYMIPVRATPLAQPAQIAQVLYGARHSPPHPAQTSLVMCLSCKQILLTYLKASRQKIWDSIPTLFNLV